jgi:hypothetical protein
LDGACTVSLQPNELLASLVNRQCRVMGLPFDEFVGRAALFDLPALRDFPIAASALTSQLPVQFQDIESLASEHSATVYFATTLEEPFRSAEIRAACQKAGHLLRLSVGTSWGHLRYCPDCARTEYLEYRYSWWHRDHQLPLTDVCLVHRCRLAHVRLRELGVSLPHEMAALKKNRSRTKLTRLEAAIARFEQYLASGERYVQMEALFAAVKAVLAAQASDAFEVRKLAWGRVKALLLQLADTGLNEPLNDWERVRGALSRLLQQGLHYGDPVALILLSASLGVLNADWLDFLEERPLPAWPRKNS